MCNVLAIHVLPLLLLHNGIPVRIIDERHLHTYIHAHALTNTYMHAYINTRIQTPIIVLFTASYGVDTCSSEIRDRGF